VVTGRLTENYSAIQINKDALNKELRQGEIVDISVQDGEQYGRTKYAGEIYISELVTISTMYSNRKMNIAQQKTAGREKKEGKE
jgi:hypothetical protein